MFSSATIRYPRVKLKRAYVLKQVCRKLENIYEKNGDTKFAGSASF